MKRLFDICYLQPLSHRSEVVRVYMKFEIANTDCKINYYIIYNNIIVYYVRYKVQWWNENERLQLPSMLILTVPLSIAWLVLGLLPGVVATLAWVEHDTLASHLDPLLPLESNLLSGTCFLRAPASSVLMPLRLVVVTTAHTAVCVTILHELFPSPCHGVNNVPLGMANIKNTHSTTRLCFCIQQTSTALNSKFIFIIIVDSVRIKACGFFLSFD